MFLDRLDMEVGDRVEFEEKEDCLAMTYTDTRSGVSIYGEVYPCSLITKGDDAAVAKFRELKHQAIKRIQNES